MARRKPNTTYMATLKDSKPAKFLQRLLERSLAEYNKYSDPAHQVEIYIQPITQPAQRILAITIGTLCVVIGIPLAAALPIVPTAPFVAIGLFCFARVSDRFRIWLSRQPVFKMAMTVICTRNEWPFRLMRAMLNRLAGGQLVYRDINTAPATNLSFVSPPTRPS